MLYAGHMDYNAIGHDSLQSFVRTTQNVVTKNPFDHLIAASDSGQLATHITKEIFDTLGQPAPPSFIAPIYRHVDIERTIIFDNAVSAPQFEAWQGRDMASALFVDDEIREGNTLNGVLRLLRALETHIADLTIIAEDGGFAPTDSIQGIPLCFVSSKPRVPEIYNAFSYTTPPEFHKPVYGALGEPGLNHKQISCTLLGLPIKDRPSGQPAFSTRLIEKAQTGLADFEMLQNGYRAWLRNTIQHYME